MWCKTPGASRRANAGIATADLVRQFIYAVSPFFLSNYLSSRLAMKRSGIAVRCSASSCGSSRIASRFSGRPQTKFIEKRIVFVPCHLNAAEHFVKGKRQNQLTHEHIAKIIDTYQFRKEETRYSRRVEMDEIKKNDFNPNISRYISTAVGEAEIDLQAVNAELVTLAKDVEMARDKHNAFLNELGLPPLP